MIQKVLRASTALLFAAAALSACTSAMPEPSPAAAIQAIKNTRTRLDKLDQRIHGTPADRSAAAFIQYVAYQLPLRDCMRAHGLTYIPPQFADTFSTWPADRPLDSIETLIPIDDEQKKRGLYLVEDLLSASLLQPVANPSYDRLDDAGKRAFADQVTACSPHPDVYADADLPDGTLVMSGKLTRTLEEVLDHPAMRELTGRYPGCMAQRGYPQVQSRHALIGQIQERHFADLMLPPTGQRLSPDDPRVVSARVAEVSAATADAACRSDSYPMAMSLIGHAVQRFERDHADELATLDRGWAAKRAQADQDRKRIDW